MYNTYVCEKESLTYLPFLQPQFLVLLIFISELIFFFIKKNKEKGYKASVNCSRRRLFRFLEKFFFGSGCADLWYQAFLH